MKKSNNKLRDKKITAVIRISNLSIPQSIALEDLLATWQQLGSAGASRWTSFFADGDGNFRPDILYNGHKPEKTDLLEEEEVWDGNKYQIDFDSIGWKILDNDAIRLVEIKKARKLRVFLGTLKYIISDRIKKLRRKLNLIKK